MDRISDGRLFHLLTTVYDKAKDGSPTSWHDVYLEIARLVSSGPGGLSLYTASDDRFSVFTGTLDPELIEQYTEYYQHISPFRKRITELSASEYFSRRESMADEAFERTEIYRDYFRKMDVYEYEYHALCDVNGIRGGLSFSRPQNMKDFSAADRKVIDFLVPHVQRAFQFHLVLADTSATSSRMAEALNNVAQPVILVNESGKSVFCNLAAERLLQAGDGIFLDREGILSAVRPGDSSELRRRIASVFEPRIESDGFEYGGTMSIEKRSGLRSLQLSIVPFADADHQIDHVEKMAMIFVSDPEQRPCPSIEMLGELYKLTIAEARLAQLIAKGNTLQEAAAFLEITENTARTHLKRVFSKTDTGRQSDLIALLMSAPVTPGK